MESKTLRTVGIAAALSVLHAGSALADSGTTVFTSSNAAAGNSIIQLAQAADGTLSVVAEYATGGAGTDGGLGNQGAIAHDGEFLFVVNAGSNDISSFRIGDGNLELADVVAAGGTRPVSITVDRGVVYVVNAGSDNIAGFTVAANGELSPLPAASQPLSAANAGPAQISFSKDGRVLVVTEKATSNIVSYPVDRRGIAGGANVVASPGQTPFGFAVTGGRRILVSEAAGGQPGLSSVSSWKVSPSGGLTVLDAVEPTLQTAACWVAVTPDGRYAYTTNTGSGSISAFRIRGDDLTLIDTDGAAADTGVGSAPIDMAIDGNGSFLHTLNTGTDTITSFSIGQDGTLEMVGTLGGLPDRATGLVAL